MRLLVGLALAGCSGSEWVEIDALRDRELWSLVFVENDDALLVLGPQPRLARWDGDSLVDLGPLSSTAHHSVITGRHRAPYLVAWEDNLARVSRIDGVSLIAMGPPLETSWVGVDGAGAILATTKKASVEPSPHPSGELVRLDLATSSWVPQLITFDPWFRGPLAYTPDGSAYAAASGALVRFSPDGAIAVVCNTCADRLVDDGGIDEVPLLVSNHAIERFDGTSRSRVAEIPATLGTDLRDIQRAADELFVWGGSGAPGTAASIYELAGGEWSYVLTPTLEYFVVDGDGDRYLVSRDRVQVWR